MNKLYRTKPYIPASDHKDILKKWADILTTGMLVQGKYISEFEESFAEYCGTKYAVATCSGATAIELAIRASGLEGSKIICPTQTFIASVSAVVRSGNTPVIADIDKDTHCLSVDSIRQCMCDDVKAVMLVHMAGYITPEYYEIKKFCDDHDLLLFEDASHAVGSIIDDLSAGNLGYAGCFSLFGTKIITTGEGGIITTNDKDVADKCKILRNHGAVRNDSPIEGIDFGVSCKYISSNYKMTETSAVLGSSQLNRADEFVQVRNRLADRYREKITNPKIEFLNVPSHILTTWWHYMVALPEGTTLKDRTDVCSKLFREYGIPTANAYWPPCHDQEVFKEYAVLSEYPEADNILHRHLSLPMYVEMTYEQVDYVADVINRAI
jgi:perosamine synthetase